MMGPNKRLAYEQANPQLEAPFSLLEYRQRLDRVRAAMSDAGIDLLFCSSPESMFYLSGYAAEWYQANSPRDWTPASCIAVHVDHDRFVHFDEEDETILIRFTSVAEDVRIRDHFGGPTMQEFIVKELGGSGWLGGTVGLEMWSYRPHRGYSEVFQSALEAAGCTVVDSTDIVRRARKVKSAQEMLYVRTAQQMADIGMRAAQETIGPGVTELEIWGELTRAMAAAGGELAAIPLPVASGPHSHCVHPLASRRALVPGDIVNVDICGVYNRYHANMARCFSLGEPLPDVAETVRKVGEGVNVVRETIRPNLPVRELNDAVEAYYREAGIFDEQWWIGGYELGIAFPPDWVGGFWYEPGVEPQPGDDLFLPGMAVNYEANFYLPRAVGLAMSINTLVFEEESAEVLGEPPNGLIVVG